MKWGILATGTIAKKFASTVEQMGAEGEHTMLSQMCDETAAKLRLISDMAELDKQKLADRATEFEEQCEKLSKALEEKKPALHLSIIEMQQEAEAWEYI